MGEIARISGVTATEVRDQMAQIVSRPVFDRAMQRLSASQRDEYLGATAVTWLPIPLVEAAIHAVAGESGMPWSDLLSEATRRTQEKLLGTVHRLFMRLTTDEWLISRTPMIYGKTYDTGALASEFPAPGQALVTLTGWPAISELQIVGLGVGIETTLRCAGRAEAKVAGRRTREGAVYQCSWKR